MDVTSQGEVSEASDLRLDSPHRPRLLSCIALKEWLLVQAALQRGQQPAQS